MRISKEKKGLIYSNRDGGMPPGGEKPMR